MNGHTPSGDVVLRAFKAIAKIKKSFPSGQTLGINADELSMSVNKNWRFKPLCAFGRRAQIGVIGRYRLAK